VKVIQFVEYGKSNVLQLSDAPVPSPGQDQVLINVRVAGVNYADIARRYGQYVVPTPLPFVPGLEVAGIVEQVGAGVTGLATGDRVVALLENGGGYAEKVLAHTTVVFKLPAEISFEDATALILQGLTAYYMLERSAQIESGDTVLVHAAAGGVGTLAIQLAKLLGGGTVIGTASTPEKRELAKQLGADILLDYTVPTWVDELKGHTAGKGVDVVLEMVGGDMLQQSLAALAGFGRLVIFGAASGQIGSIDALQLMSKCQTVTGFWLTYALRSPNWAQSAMANMFSWVNEGKLRVTVGGSFALHEAAHVHDLLEGRKTVGKLLLKP